MAGAIHPPTPNAFEPTLSQHFNEPDVTSATRSVELPSVRDQSESLLEGFQDIPLNNSDSQILAIESTELGISVLNTEQSDSNENYENLWASDPVTTAPSEVTQMPSAEPMRGQPAPESTWGTFDDSEKSFSNEVFEAVESRSFDEEIIDVRGGGEATEILGGDPGELADDLQSFREETAQAFAPRPTPPMSPTIAQSSAPTYAPSSAAFTPPGKHGTSPSLRPTSSLVDHSSAAAATALQHHSQSPGMSDEELRKIIREEIQTAITGWLKNRLHDELDRVLEEIDRE